jgi:nitrite reductase/ring-hydroxylating ferredoxin subunit
MRWLPLLKVTELAPGQCTNIFIGHMGIALANIDGQFYAADNRCPHDGGPLGMGQMDKEWIICPYHGWAYSMKDGAYDNDRSRFMTTLPVKIEGDDVMVQLPDEGQALPEPEYMCRHHQHK